MREDADTAHVMNTCRSLSRSYSQPYAREGLKQGHKSNTENEPNFHRTTGSRHNPEQSSTGFGVEQGKARAMAHWHMQNGMPREEHLDRAQVRAAHSDVKRGGTHPCMH